MTRWKLSPLAPLSLLLLSPNLHAQETAYSLQEHLDIVWVLVAGVLVFFMQAGFALLETGMSRAKNAVNVMMKNYTDVCMASVIFWLIGYSLMFGENNTGFYGFSGLGLAGDSPFDYAYLFFQAMFAATAATICSGAMAERTKYNSYILSAAMLIAVVYPVYGSWVWNGGGWLAQLGFIDFAGSTVVHSIGAWCALAGIIAVGPRLGRFDKRTGETRPIQGHNLTLVGIGGFILWFGWFGFNPGSTLAAVPDIASIAINTHLAASAGALGSILTFVLRGKPVLMTSVVNGSLAGLVAITAGCASMTIEFAMITGFVGGIICVLGSDLLLKLQVDDVVGAVPVHGFSGAWGTLAAGMFVTGDLFNVDQIVVQLIGIGAGFLWAFPLSLLIYFLISKTMGLRADSLHEQRGLDVTEHAEIGFPEFQQNQTFKTGS
jgi:Amt family ammonium transporter